MIPLDYKLASKLIWNLYRNMPNKGAGRDSKVHSDDIG